MPSSPEGAGPVPARWIRPTRRAAAAAAGIALLWAAAHALADHQAVRARVREKAEAILASRLPGAALGDEVSIDWLFRASVGPLTIPARTTGAPPVVGVERVKVRLALLPLLSGRLEPASVRLYGVHVAPGPNGRELLELAARLRRPRSGAAGAKDGGRGADPVIHLRHLTVDLVAAGRSVELGPVDLRLERMREPGAETIEAELELAGGGRLSATLRRVTSEGASDPSPRAASTPPGLGEREGAASGPPSWTLNAHLSASTRDLPARLRGRAVEASGGALALEVRAEGSAGAARATLRAGLDGLVLRGEALGPEAVGPLALVGEAEVEGSLAGRRVHLRRAVLRPAGPVVVELAGELSAGDEPALQLSVKVPPVDYGALLAALPRALAPGPEAPRPAGTVGGSLELSGALRAPEGWSVKAEVALDGLREASRRGPPSPLLAPFTAHPDGPDGPAVVLGPASRDFVPIAELPQHVVRAVTTSEDAGFYAHRGFDFDELRNALVAGFRAGKLQRGGSTITQQLAKNLYLSRDRTLARKAREALLTVALEGTVPKPRLLEIYLNLIEWGPSLHGIGPAARHYLDKDARELTPREACFLAALIPSPLRSHAALAAGVPVERWGDRVDDLLRKLATTGVIDEETLAHELAAPVALAGWAPRAETGGAPAGPPVGREDEEEEARSAEERDSSTPTPTPTSTSTPTSTPDPAPTPAP